jgi:hypothetical protein
MDKVDKIVSPREARSPAAKQPFIARSVAKGFYRPQAIYPAA